MESTRNAVCKSFRSSTSEIQGQEQNVHQAFCGVLLKDMDTLYLLQSSLEYLICFPRSLEVVLLLLCSSSEEHVLLFLRISLSARTRTAISLLFHWWSILAWEKVVLFICVLNYCWAIKLSKHPAWVLT